MRVGMIMEPYQLDSSYTVVLLNTEGQVTVCYMIAPTDSASSTPHRYFMYSVTICKLLHPLPFWVMHAHG